MSVFSQMSQIQLSQTRDPAVRRESGLEIETVEDTRVVAEQWSALADEMAATPFQRPGWFDLWRSAFVPAARPKIVAVARGGKLVGVLPLLLDGNACKAPVNAHTPMFGPVATDEDAAAALAAAALRLAPRRLCLGQLDAASATTRTLVETAARHDRRPLLRVEQRSPFVRIEGSWKEYEARIKARQRSHLRRRRRNLEQQGSVRVDVDDGTHDLERLLAEGFALEASGWKDAAGTAIASNATTIRFYTEIARWAARRGGLRLAFLRLDGRPIAFQLTLEEHGSWYCLKGGFDPAYQRFAPARVLVHALLELAFTSGLATYELLGDDEQWKRVWTADTRTRVRLTTFPPSPIGHAEHLAAAFVDRRCRPLVRRARRRRAAGRRESSRSPGSTQAKIPQHPHGQKYWPAGP